MRADQEYTIQLQEWLMREGLTYPAMPMDGAQPTFFTINGRAYPETDVIRMRVGETLKLRFIGSSGGFIHPMHVHGGPFTVVAREWRRSDHLRGRARIDGHEAKPSSAVRGGVPPHDERSGADQTRRAGMATA